MAVFLPRINYMEVSGFDKIFKEDYIKIDFSAPLNMLLGGNGLGKTTLLQSIVYTLTGGVYSPEVERDKNLRWNHNFFKGRVFPEKLSTASLTVNFNLGETEITVKRGLASNRVSEFSIKQDDYADSSFEDAITQFGGYEDFDSFVFIVNRVLYLSENRRSLTWDYDGQVRSLMILSNDIVNEKAYRNLRAEIKNLDSNKRHTTVRINKYQIEIDKRKKDYPELDTQVQDATKLIKDRADLSEKLQTLLAKRDDCATKLKEFEERRRELAEEVNELSDRIRKDEAQYLFESLLNYDDKKALLFGKTINMGICPCCGELSADFQTLAKQRLFEGECMVCGKTGFGNVKSNVEINALTSQLAEKLTARDNANKRILHLRNQIQSLDNEIFPIRKLISAIDYSSYVNADKVEDDFDTEQCIEDIVSQLGKLKSDRESLENDIRIQTEEADSMYAAFIDNFSERSKKLSAIYKELASAFLGKEVTLKFENSTDKFVNIDYLIPVFDKEPRKSPEDCSEAQRFFLDIAFRMALIGLNYKLTNSTGSFICETPESALDVSYVDNVVKMFFGFIEEENRLILSNNLQKLGLAYLLIENAKRSQKPFVVFDLLEHGKLSEVQSRSEELFKIREEIIGRIEL